MSSYRSEPGVVGLRVEHLSRRRRDPARFGPGAITPAIGRGDVADNVADVDDPSYEALLLRCRVAIAPVVALPFARYDDTAPSTRTQ